jgi:DNA-binding response OmpR family regulator
LDNGEMIPSHASLKSVTVLILGGGRFHGDDLARKLRGRGCNVYHTKTHSDGINIIDQMQPDILLFPHGSDLELLISRGVEWGSELPSIEESESDPGTIVGLKTAQDDYFLVPDWLLGVFSHPQYSPSRPAHEVRVTELRAGDLRLDLVARRAFRDGSEIRFSPREFELLATLIENAGISLSREYLLLRVWGSEISKDSRTVDVHIRWIREKLEPDPSSPRRIITVKGWGYYFDG